MTLAAYITSNFGQVKTQLGWSDSLQITTITDKAIEWYGVDTEAEATNAKKIHALVDVAVWRQVGNDIGLDYSFSADGASYSRNQAVENVQSKLDAAITEALVYMPNYQIGVSHSDDHPDWTS